MEERLKIAIFIDFDNIQIGVKDTLSKEFDVSLVLEALKERGEVISKIAYGDWPRSSEYSRQMTQHAVQMVQRSVTPRGDKNGADINLALDALEMAFTRNHINTFVIVGGDSDFIALVEKLKQYDKRVIVVGGRQFTSNILQKNCHEFIAYENLLRDGDGSRRQRQTHSTGRAASEARPVTSAFPNVQRALKILAEREVAPQLGLLKSTLQQLDPTFSERDYGSGSFLDFIQKMQTARLVQMRKTDRGYLVEPLETEFAPAQAAEPEVSAEAAASEPPAPARETEQVSAPAPTGDSTQALDLLKRALAGFVEKTPNRPLYLRQIRQMLRSLDNTFDERRYGFHGILDLLHHAQREGTVRLHRDRKGVLRVFPVTSGAAEPAPPAEPVAVQPPSEETEVPPVEADVIWEEIPQPEEPVETQEAVAAPPEGEVAAEVQAPEGPKPRRRKRAEGAVKSGARRPSTRRKAKEPPES